MPTITSPRRRPSRSANRRSKILPSLPAKVRPGLALDTSVSRHRAPAPQQIFPYESKPQDLSFISLADIKALKKQKSINKARQKQLDEAQSRSGQRSYTEEAVRQTGDAPPPYSRDRTTDAAQAPPLHKRVKGLRPSPLDLSTDISPSDRAITIGISVDPNAVPRHSRTPSSPVAAQLYPVQRRPSEKSLGQEAITPTIVITPAKEDFDFDLKSDSHSAEESGLRSHRPTSSIYSRHTNCMPANGYTPPVPPLPLFAIGNTRQVSESKGMVHEDEPNALHVPKRERKKNLSVCTVFEEDQPTATAAKRLTSQSSLPTPRRSRGWWNFITSPFSASSKSTAFFWRSPPPVEEGDTSRMLGDVSEVDSDPHAGLIFTNRGPEDLDLRSAPPIGSQRSSLSAGRPRQPKRSDTAPGALDPNGVDGVDIYHIPYVGAAADYYNPHKNFPSLILDPQILEHDRGLDRWSPSQSVYREPRGSVKGVVIVDDDGHDTDSTSIDDDHKPFDDQAGSSRALVDSKSPFSDAHASNAFEGFSGTQPAATADKKFFSTPCTEELRGASPPERPRPEPTRGETQATVESHFSPLTATPIIEDARMGTLLGPSVVDVRSAHSSRPGTPHASGIGAVTMASRGLDDDARPMSEKAPFKHQRNDSYGLGIDTDGESEKSLFPPPKPLAQQPRLGTDRFGQLRIEKDGDHEPDWSPWYRRFLWPLLGIGAGLLLLFVVLLVMFVSQRHDDMPVQAQWLNLTGFPAMPTGIATVVQPSKNADVGDCVKPGGLWSCAAPPEAGDTGTNAVGDDVPNFRFEIRFRNKTRSDINSTNIMPASYKRSISGASIGSSVVKRSAWSELLYDSQPAPPSEQEMAFLGNTTDDITEPFEGEATPFYISLLNASALASPEQSTTRLLKREEKGAGVYPYPTDPASSASNNDNDKNSTTSADNDHLSASTSTPSKLPRPLLRPNGEPAAPQLYPLATAQPLRLFNRGRQDEHYGFSTFFDRSVYFSTPTDNATSPPSLSNATSNSICTFSQTRLHVQIWTRRGTVVELGSSGSATDMRTPGSFPYPVTVTLDRHGGDAGRKGVYCYGLDADGHVVSGSGTWVDEDRSFGGEVVNPGGVPGEGQEKGVRKRHEDGAGIDGGDGGCMCSWRSGSGGRAE